VDGIFGTGTAASVRTFQTGAGLPADGVVDARTWSRLVG
jgi:peptidoglycan hydrolase-like protein with peptidoglycan-binding domain